jgi:hypothetical protein
MMNILNLCNSSNRLIDVGRKVSATVLHKHKYPNLVRKPALWASANQAELANDGHVSSRKVVNQPTWEV